MKQKLLFLFCCLAVLPSAAQTGSWDYPVKPGTSKWVSLIDHRDMINACLIPDEVLHAISTSQLIDLCMEYPLSVDVLAYKTPMEGYKIVSGYFNGIPELLSREDNKSQLLSKLKKVNSESNSTYVMSEREKSEFVLRKIMLDLICSDKKMISTLSGTQLKEFASEAAKNVLYCNQKSEEVEGMELDTSIFFLASLLVQSNPDVKKSPAITNFLKTGVIKEKDSLIEDLMQYYSTTF